MPRDSSLTPHLRLGYVPPARVINMLQAQVAARAPACSAQVGRRVRGDRRPGRCRDATRTWAHGRMGACFTRCIRSHAACMRGNTISRNCSAPSLSNCSLNSPLSNRQGLVNVIWAMVTLKVVPEPFWMQVRGHSHPSRWSRSRFGCRRMGGTFIGTFYACPSLPPGG